MPEETQTSDVDVEAGTDATPLEAAGESLGDDLFGPEPASESSSAETDDPSGDEGEQFDIDSVDILSISPDKLPDTFKPLQKYARRWQGEMDRFRAQVEKEQKAAQEERTRYLEAIKQIGQPQQKAAPEDPYADVPLTPQEKAGLQRLEQGLVNRAVQPLMDQIKSLTEQVEQLSGGYQQIEQQTKAQQAQALQTEISEMEKAYPDADKNRQDVRALVQAVNPQTGTYYTFKQAWELLNGITAENASQARNRSNGIRNGAKRVVGPRPPINSNSPDTTDLHAELVNLGFEE